MQPIALPISLAVPGKAVSHQSKDSALKNKWKAHVRSCAVAAVGDRAPYGGNVTVTVIFFFDCPDGNTSGVPDGDNIWKLIFDALNGVVYNDDEQITDHIVRKRDLNKPFVIKGMKETLAIALAKGKEFCYITVDHPPSHSDLC